MSILFNRAKTKLMITITRKIEVYVNEPDKGKKKKHYDKLFNWLYTCRKLANLISSHKFVQDNIKDFFYLTEDVQYKLANSKKDPAGLFITSKQNTTYKVVANKLKGELPSSILTNLNQVVSKSYNEERKEYYSGDRSLRSYKNNLPIPFGSRDITQIQLDPKKKHDYTFNLFGVPLKTKFGRDRSNNAIIFYRSTQSKEYKLCSSSLQYDKRKKKWFLLMCVQFEPKKDKLIDEKKIECELGVDIPIVAKIKKEEYTIGDKQEFLHHRIRIQEALRKRQMNARYNKGGHGRKRKIQGIEFFKNKEKNYVTTKLHQYSSKLVQLALKNKCSEIILINQEAKEQEAKEQKEKGNDFILKNWSYYGLKTLINYKAKKHGITVKVL
jgi:IS605 OrfB family transposase